MKQLILFITTFIFVFTPLSSQVTITGTYGKAAESGKAMTVTSTRKIKRGDTKLIKLDEATIRCAYRFTQPVYIEKETFQQTDTMILDIGNKISRYYDAHRMMRDSLFSNLMKEKMSINTIQSIAVMKDGDMSAMGPSGPTIESETKGETSVMLKNRLDKEITIIDKGENRDNYKCIDKVEPQQWSITSDTLTILGYLCQKATTEFRGRNYEAWFTPDIPINEGPWKFYGLPGMILKVNDSEDLFSFEIIGLEQLANPVDITMPEEEYINCKLKDLQKLKEKRSGGMGISINGGNIVMVQKKNNNKYLHLEN